MPNCYAKYCSHNSLRDTCHFYRFPFNDKARLTVWKFLCGTKRELTMDSRLCSCHFPQGVKSFGPSIFHYSRHAMSDLLLNEDSLELKTEPALSFISMGVDLSDVRKIISENLQAEVKDKRRRKVLKEGSDEESESNDLSPPITIQFTIGMLKSDFYVSYYTGVPSFCFLKYLASYCAKRGEEFNKIEVNLNREDQILLTLMKFRHNFELIDLGVRFGIKDVDVLNVITTWSQVLHSVLWKITGNGLSKASDDENNDISETLRIIFGCHTVHGETKVRFSEDDTGIVMKSLLGVSPNGAITFTSNLYPAGTPDPDVYVNARIVDFFLPGDRITTEQRILEALGELENCNFVPSLYITLNVPGKVSMLVGKNSAWPKESTNKNMSNSMSRNQMLHISAQNHFDRAVDRIKQFKILKEIPCAFRECSTKIFQTIVAISNLQFVEEGEMFIKDE